VAPWQRWPAPFAPSGPRAELASWGDAGECISGSCMDRIAATRARSTFPQRRPAGCRLRPGAGWPGWMGSERSGWKLLPSEVIYHVYGRLRGPARSGALQEQQHQGRLLLLRLLGQAGGAGCPPPSAVWWVYARVRHPKAAFDTASSDMQRRTACPGPELAAVLPARPPADLRGRLGPNITQGCQHEPNMAASITCAASESHLHITGTRANAESRQKCRPCSMTWPRVLLAAQAALLVSWGAGREHRRWFWAKA
jgi:hypothetical protein